MSDPRHIGLVALIGAAAIATAPQLAGAAPNPAPAAHAAHDPAATAAPGLTFEHQRPVGSRATPRPKPIAIRQTLTYGRQATWVAGVKLTEHAGAISGRAGQLRARLGGWECADGWAERIGAFSVQLVSPNGGTCDARRAAVASFVAYAPGSRLITEHGSVRIGQAWRTTPRSLRSRVHYLARGTRDNGGVATYWIGRNQDPCRPTRPVPRSQEPEGNPSPVGVGVARNGRVVLIGASPRIYDTVVC